MGALTLPSSSHAGRALSRCCAVARVLLTLALSLCAARARADAEGEARARYERALELYESGVYDAALVELDRAYELRPSYKLLYNLGQVRMAMNDYAGALEAYREYLREAGQRLPAARRQAVQDELTKLEQRVAELTIECDVSEAEVLVDDLLVGTTPLAAPVLVNAGLRRVLVRHARHGSQTKRVSLAGADHQTLSVHLLPAASDHDSQSASANLTVAPAPEPGPPPLPDLTVSSPSGASRSTPATQPAHRETRRTLRVVSWSLTGGLLACALTTGLLAMQSSNELEAMREHELVTRAELRQQESHTSRLALASDLLTGLTVVAAAASLWVTLKREHPRPSSARAARARTRQLELGLGPRGLLVHTRF